MIIKMTTSMVYDMRDSRLMQIEHNTNLTIDNMSCDKHFVQQPSLISNMHCNKRAIFKTCRTPKVTFAYTKVSKEFVNKTFNCPAETRYRPIVLFVIATEQYMKFRFPVPFFSVCSVM